MSHQSILEFPARLLPSLPSAVRFEMYHHETNTVLHVFTCEVVAPTEHIDSHVGARGEQAGVVIDGIELEAMIRGVETGRVWPADLSAWLAAKKADPEFRIVHEAVLGGTQPPPSRPWTFGRVAAQLGLELRGWALVETMSRDAALAA